LFQDENLLRCSISADSRIENSGSEDSSDDDNLDIKDNGYHDAENEVDVETDDDPDRVHSGKLSESSGYAGSDLYDYKVSLSLSHVRLLSIILLMWGLILFIITFKLLSV
jgi:hypothetical protein